MTPADFDAYRHRAVHRLMELNEECERNFRVGHWERWDYDLEAATLTFSDGGVPRIIAQIQAVGSTSNTSMTWLWGWANESLPPGVVARMQEVREYGRNENVAQLGESKLPDDEHLGWAMTAIAANIIGAKGAYRCPSERGFLYFVFTDLAFADLARTDTSATFKRTVVCSTHGQGTQTFICEHLVARPGQQWFSNTPTPEDRWPDAWCTLCEQFYQEQGEWNDSNSERIKIKLLCHRCYELLRAQQTT
jgi:hypothetical protein